MSDTVVDVVTVAVKEPVALPEGLGLGEFVRVLLAVGVINAVGLKCTRRTRILTDDYTQAHEHRHALHVASEAAGLDASTMSDATV